MTRNTARVVGVDDRYLMASDEKIRQIRSSGIVPSLQLFSDLQRSRDYVQYMYNKYLGTQKDVRNLKKKRKAHVYKETLGATDVKKYLRKRKVSKASETLCAT